MVAGRSAANAVPGAAGPESIHTTRRTWAGSCSRTMLSGHAGPAVGHHDDDAVFLRGDLANRGGLFGEGAGGALEIMTVERAHGVMTHFASTLIDPSAQTDALMRLPIAEPTCDAPARTTHAQALRA